MEGEALGILSITKRLKEIEQDLKEVRQEIEGCAASFATERGRTAGKQIRFTLDDLYEAFGKKKSHYATRLRSALEYKGIATLEDFLALSPGELLDLEGVGVGTLEQTNNTLKRMGIRW